MIMVGGWTGLRNTAGLLLFVAALLFLVVAVAAVFCAAIAPFADVRACHRLLSVLSPPR